MGQPPPHVQVCRGCPADMVITCSATLSASCSAMSPGRLIASVGDLAATTDRESAGPGETTRLGGCFTATVRMTRLPIIE
jgi:hypothetical protein